MGDPVHVKLILLMAAVFSMLLFERAAILLATRSRRGCDWIRNHRLLHPNTISFIRMPMGIVSVLIWGQGFQATALLWFAAWMITDLTDGTIARACGLETESGKWLDPFSDKCMYFPPLIYFVARGELSAAWIILLLLLDTAGQASRLFAKKKAANSFGKAKTAFITILLALAALHGMVLLDFIRPEILYVLTLSCTVLAFLSLYCKVIPDIWYANSLTMANFLCGIGAIWQVVAGHPVRAFVLVFLGQFFDLFDGRLARKFGSTRYGAAFDDIADGTSFGLAIGFVILSELGGGFTDTGKPLDWNAISPVGWGVAVLYVICVIYRLIRFLMPTIKVGPGIFQGFPSPAGAVLAGSAAMLFDEWKALGLALILVASFLMISNIRYRHFGQRIWPSLPNMMKLLLFVFFLALANTGVADKNYKFSFCLVCFTMVLVYAVFGIEWRPDATESHHDDGKTGSAAV